jgi:hypothetical protein
MKNKHFQELYLVLEQKLAKDATDNSNQVSKLGGMLASSVHQIGNRIQQESERTDFITNKTNFLEHQWMRSLGPSGLNTSNVKEYTDSQIDVLRYMFASLD